jgi:hypothetical protein
VTRRQRLVAHALLTVAGLATATIVAVVFMPLAGRYGTHLAAAGARHTGLSQAVDTLTVGVPAVLVLCAVVIGAGRLRKAVRRNVG